MFRKIAMTATALCLSVTFAAADDAVVAKREQMMKQIAGSLGVLAAIGKGTKPYDAAVVKTSLTTISTDIKAFPDQFPAGSEANSEAAPAIWINNADFRAHATKLGNDADTLLAALPADQAGVAQAVQTLSPSCGACHQTYRLKK